MFTLPKLPSTPKKRNASSLFVGLNASPTKADKIRNQWDRIRSLKPFPKLKKPNVAQPEVASSSQSRPIDRRPPTPTASCEPTSQCSELGCPSDREASAPATEEKVAKTGRGGNRKKEGGGVALVNNTIVRLMSTERFII